MHKSTNCSQSKTCDRLGYFSVLLFALLLFVSWLFYEGFCFKKKKEKKKEKKKKKKEKCMIENVLY